MAQVVTAARVRARGITRLTATFTTHTDGVVTITPIGSAFGRIVAIEYNPVSGTAGATTVATGADITISDSVGSALLVLTDAGVVGRRVRPTAIPVTPAGAAVTPGAGYDGTKDVWVAGLLSLTVAQGGDTKTGVVNVIVAEGEPAY